MNATGEKGPLLQVSGLTAGYGKIVVLRDIALTIGAGEAVALLGPNGAGKTTLLRAMSGLLPRTGQVRFAGKDITSASPRETVRAGLVHVVEGHRVFTQLSGLRQSAARRLRPAARRARDAGRGGTDVLSRDRRQAQRPRRHPVGRPAADARRRAGPGRAATPPDARRAVGRPVAGAGRSRAGRRRRGCARRAPPCCWSSS